MVGMIPPPIGGVSTHVWNLSARLRDSGADCTVVDLEACEGKYALPGVTRVEVGCRMPLRLVTALRASHPSQDEIVHFHMSSGGRMLPLIAATRLGSPEAGLAITIHDGGIAERYAALSAVRRSFFRRVLGSADVVFALNPAIRSFLIDAIFLSPDRVVESTSFVTPDRARVDAEVLAEPLATVRRRARRLLVGSGFAMPYYRHEDLFEVAASLNASTGCEVVLATYGGFDRQYRDALIRTAAAHDFIHILEDVDYLQFLKLLRSADAYVRTSSVDSCGLAAWESAALGTPSVATDVCRRHPSTLLYTTADLDALRHLIAGVLEDPDRARRAMVENSADDAVKSVLVAYSRVSADMALRRSR